MSTRKRTLPALAAALWLAGLAPAQDGPRAPKNLRVEHLVNPLGLGERKPRFSWEVDDPRMGAVQSAYRIVVMDPPRIAGDPAVLWDSGKVASSRTAQVEYGGRPLQSGGRYAWTVDTWDGADRQSPVSGPATFGMGLLEPSDWKAQWIGDATPPPPAARANNGFHSRFADKEDDYKWVQIDLGEEKIFDGFRLHPARPYDWTDTPGFLFPVQIKIWVSDDPEFTKSFQKIIDKTGFDVPNPGATPLDIPLTNIRYRIRYVRLGVFKMGRIEGKGCAFALAEMEVLNGAEVVSRGAKVTAGDSIETGAWSTSNLTDGDVVSHAASGWDPLPAPMLSRSFTIDGHVARATLYASALGLYEIRINGHRAGDQVLAPGWTDYRARVPYQAIDVARLLRIGDNVVAAQLADGWYAGKLGLSWLDPNGPPRGIYGRKPRLLAQLEIGRMDETRQTISTDASWKSTTAGPVRSADLLDGEIHDARAEMPGLGEPGFDASAWKPVEVATDAHPQLVAQACEPIRIIQELKAVAVTEPKPGVFVFDLGQNFAGWCRLNLAESAGTTVTLRHAEVLNEDGTIYTADLRGAAQTDRYTCRGGEDEIFEPRFTYHGFRYVEVTGLSKKPDPGALVGCVVGTDAPEVGSFECSDPMLNKLWQNILWTQRANMMSVPTDCPQRDERLGWTGDMQVFAQTAAFQRDMAAFFTKWLQDVRDAQADDGRYPDFAPHPYGKNERFTGTPAWGDAGVIVPWVAYVNYGDERPIEAHLDSMIRWIEWIHAKNPDLVWKNDRGNDYGDWLNGDHIVHEGWPKQGGGAPKDVLATAFFARSTRLVSKMAAAVGRSEEAKRYGELAEAIATAFRKAFAGEDGKIQGDTQAGYALALAFDLLPQEMQALALSRLAKNITDSYGGHLSTGFQSTARAMIELSRRGEHDLATAIATRTDFPSWGYAIENGATTIWERWDGFAKDRGFQDPGMNSFSHYAFGSIGEWMMRMVAGIEPDEEHPGWDRFSIHPRTSTRITWARGTYHSMHGTIACSWRLSGDSFRLDVTIPPNTAAKVFVPTTTDKVGIGGKGATKVVRFVGREGEAFVYDVPAGSYTFGSAFR